VTENEGEGEAEKLHIANHLWDCLDDYQRQHEEGYAEPETDEERKLHDAMKMLEDFALRLISTGTGVDALDPAFSDFMPGTNIAEKVTSLLDYNLVRDRLQFAVAQSVVDRLSGLERRIVEATIAFAFLLRANPSETAVKYFERASSLFLAGYDGEVIIMCGAVLEAAAAQRIPDEQLRDLRIKPKNRKTGTYSIGQRMTVEEQRQLLTTGQRESFWEIVNWRNDAAHVQPDIGPKPDLALIMTAAVLGSLLPRIV
jgi:hypothetical protein